MTSIARLPRPARMVLMLAAALALLAALWAGLIRIGWGWPPLAPRLPGSHGPLMVCGFLGTLIGVERAVGLGRRWMLAAPALTALGTALLFTPLPVETGALLIALGSVVFVATVAQLLRIQRALFIVTLVLGSLLWLIGNLLWLAGQPIPVATLWWMGFLVITVAGERLELSRLLRLRQLDSALFVACLALMAGGMALGVLDYAAGTRLLGLGLLAMAGWLLRYDIAWRRLKAGGQARFAAICLLSGYFWLAAGGMLAILYGGMSAGPTYDAILHTVFVGFVFSMIFAHAPIILPAVLQVPIAYLPRFYAHLALLHASLLLRVAGDLLPNLALRRWGGLLNAVALLLFLASTLFAVRRARAAGAAFPSPARDPVTLR